MDWFTLARALHVLAVVHWIGGVTMVTLVILPGILRLRPVERQMETFAAIEERFAGQARISVTLAGLSGFYMVHALDAWERFTDPAFWWMHAMVALWAVFTIVLFVAEPLYLHRKVKQMAAQDSPATFRLVLRLHRILLALATVTTAGAVLGSHGFTFGT